MTEKDFWVWYVKSRFFLGPEAPETNGNPLNEYFQKSQENASGSHEDASSNGANSVDNVSRLVDLRATAEDHHSDVNTFTGRAQEGTLSLIRKLNTHSIKVVKSTASIASSSALPISIEEATVLEDLRVAPDSTPILLQVDAAKIESSQKKSHDYVAFDPKFLEFIKQGRLKLDPIAFADSVEMTAAERNAKLPPLPSKSQANHDISDEIPPDVATFNLNAKEILQHYWGCQPIGKDANRAAKAQRMTTILEQLQIQGRSLITSRPTLPEQSTVECLLLPSMQCIEWALSHRKTAK